MQMLALLSWTLIAASLVRFASAGKARVLTNSRSYRPITMHAPIAQGERIRAALVASNNTEERLD
jgi:hypothetical protein